MLSPFPGKNNEFCVTLSAIYRQQTRPSKPRNIQPHVKCTNQPDSEDVIISSNFASLAEHDPVFLQLAGTAEHVFAADPTPR